MHSSDSTREMCIHSEVTIVVTSGEKTFRTGSHVLFCWELEGLCLPTHNFQGTGSGVLGKKTHTCNSQTLQRCMKGLSTIVCCNV